MVVIPLNSQTELSCPTMKCGTESDPFCQTSVSLLMPDSTNYQFGCEFQMEDCCGTYAGDPGVSCVLLQVHCGLGGFQAACDLMDECRQRESACVIVTSGGLIPLP